MLYCLARYTRLLTAARVAVGTLLCSFTLSVLEIRHVARQLGAELASL